MALQNFLQVQENIRQQDVSAKHGSKYYCDKLCTLEQWTDAVIRCIFVENPQLNEAVFVKCTILASKQTALNVLMFLLLYINDSVSVYDLS